MTLQKSPLRPYKCDSALFIHVKENKRATANKELHWMRISRALWLIQTDGLHSNFILSVQASVEP